MRKSQNYFAFKQFTIQQEHCAMKVSTDACIQGAWTPLSKQIHTVLDVGTGTGLLSLMLAQRAPQLKIDALEIDADASKQASENITNSTFAERIRVINEDAKVFNPTHRYDLIVCNPPFFSQDLVGPNVHRNSVRHDELLKAEDLVSLARRGLEDDGALCIMWPERRTAEWTALMHEADFHLCDELLVRNNTGARISSIISLWRTNLTEPFRSDTLFIRNESGNYSPEFVALLRDFYLRL